MLPVIFNYQIKELLDINIAKDVISIMLNYLWLDVKNISLTTFSKLICIETVPDTHEIALDLWNDFVLYGSHIRLYTDHQKWKRVSERNDLYRPRSTGTPGYKQVLDKFYNSKNQVETLIAFYHDLILEQLVRSSHQHLLWYRAENFRSCSSQNWVVLVRWTVIR